MKKFPVHNFFPPVLSFWFFFFSFMNIDEFISSADFFVSS